MDERAMSEYVYRSHGEPLANDSGEIALAREEIVRCRDCHWVKPDQSDHDYRGEYHCNMWITDVSADGYCWRGSRKEATR